MQLPNFITYKEIMIVYNVSRAAAMRKLTNIRAALGKERFQSVLIVEYCKAENIERSLFENELREKTQQLYQPKQSVQLAFNLG